MPPTRPKMAAMEDDDEDAALQLALALSLGDDDAGAVAQEVLHALQAQAVRSPDVEGDHFDLSNNASDGEHASDHDDDGGASALWATMPTVGMASPLFASDDDDDGDDGGSGRGGQAAPVTPPPSSGVDLRTRLGGIDQTLATLGADLRVLEAVMAATPPMALARAVPAAAAVGTPASATRGGAAAAAAAAGAREAAAPRRPRASSPPGVVRAGRLVARAPSAGAAPAMAQTVASEHDGGSQYDLDAALDAFQRT
jgi:hypothetical protein